MTEKFREGENHTGEAFLEFAYDLLEYALPKYGYEFERPPEFKAMHKKIFMNSFGDAVMLFYSRHESEFQDGINAFIEGASDGDIVNYSDEFCKRTFKGKVPLMELITYCAFVLHTSIFCLTTDETDEMHQVVDEVFGVFYTYIEKYFTIVGGWHALYRVAEQYVSYVNFTPRDVSASAAKGVEVSKL